MAVINPTLTVRVVIKPSGLQWKVRLLCFIARLLGVHGEFAVKEES